MNSPTPSEPKDPQPGRWKLALDSSDAPPSQAAFRVLAEGYWYCVYAWWRRAGLDSQGAGAATLASFGEWLAESPPQPADCGSARLRDWLAARLAELSVTGVKPDAEPPIAIDPAWAEARYADEPEGDADAIFQRRWALTILEFTTSALQAEYAARGEDDLFKELLPFSGFEGGGDDQYASAASRTGRTSGAMRKAVFDFRIRHRAVLREIVADTVTDPGDIESEITALLIACDAAGSQGATAPMPTILRSTQPDQILARAMESVKMSSADLNGWTPPSVQDAARLFPTHEVLALLGRGAMGAVYQARQSSLDRLVAIKLLPLEISVDRDFADRFRREARAMAKLSHPNIISVFDFGQTSEGHLYFVMEFVDGAMLHTLIHGGKRNGAGDLQPAEALALAGQVCDALAYAHEQGVVHRDIKPANVMIDRRGRAKVADFGLARMTESDPSQWGTTMTGVIMGTPDYMAPEQKRGMHVDHRADIYSLGVMLYEMLCKETPQGAFALPSKRCGLDKRLDAIITKALAQKAEERFQSTAEMKAAIEIVRPAVAKAQSKKPKPLAKSDCGINATSPHTTPSHDSALGRAETMLPTAAGSAVSSPGRNRTPIYVGLVVLLVLIAGAILFVRKSERGIQASTPAVQPTPPAEPATPRVDPATPPVPPASLAVSGIQTPPSERPKDPPPKEIAINSAKTAAVATKETPFINTLGMRFVPVPITSGPTSGQRLLFSIWETRVQDYEVFAKETTREWPKPTFPQGPAHPVVMMTRDDAKAFCEWLTARARKAGKIAASEHYRLPSDHEWSCAVGIGDREDPKQAPEDKDVKIKDVYPWGTVWPPPPGTGNYSGEEAAGHEVWNGQKIIAGYRDDFPETAPVGSFRPDQLGIYDLSGNAHEWCEDRWNADVTAGVLRGASFDNGSAGFLLSCNRSKRDEGKRGSSDGFRVVLAADPAKATAPAADARAVPFVNMLGMKFVAVPIIGGPTTGQRVLFCVWDTRVQDYEVFAKETQREWPKLDFSQGPTHPAVDVSWEDAQLFCQWRTAREQAAGRLPAQWRYRLPSDHEWSCAVGIGASEDAAKPPMEKSNKLKGQFAGGAVWPPPAGAGNYAGEELQPALAAGRYSYVKDVLPGFNDGFINTSPAGAFPANQFSLFDMSGNVWQWCEDWSDKDHKERVLRGGAWTTAAPDMLQSSARFHDLPGNRNNNHGFRCVLVPEPAH